MKKIILRAFANVNTNKKDYTTEIKKHRRVLVFDTETTTDEYQNLKIGFFQVYQDNIKVNEGLFYINDLPNEDIKVLQKYSRTYPTSLYTLDKFKDIFYKEVYNRGTLCIGYNLAFDISRIAQKYGYSRKYNKGGFTFTLSKDINKPPIIIKKLGDANTFKFQRNIANKGKSYKSGYFLDVQTISKIILDKRRISLDKSCEILNTTTKKMKNITHGKITKLYIDYLITDVKSTFEVYLELLKEFKKYDIDIPLEKTYSSASLGKQALAQLGIKSFFNCNPNFSKELIGIIMSTYYGGRCECVYRKKPVKIDYLDFTSMYPTITLLYGIWDFIIAEQITTEDVTDEIKNLVENIDLESLKNKELFRQFNVLVKIKPNKDLLPIRFDYKNKNENNNLGLNYLTSDKELWYTLPDIISSKILTGKAPQILEAIRFKPNGIQSDLKKSKIVGVNINPKKENLIKICVDKRQEIKKEIKELKKDDLESKRLDGIQRALKILVNTFGYGIFIELNPKEVKNNIKFMV